MTVECHDCGSRFNETAFPQITRATLRGEARLCLDCSAERVRVALRGAPPARVKQTRASYRAALRARRKLAQMDLVDQIVEAP